MEVLRTFTGYQVVIFDEYSSLQDYLWKSPQFIEHEAAREKEKLWTYFPDAGTNEEREQNKTLRRIRSSIEVPKLIHWFPRNISSANLFLSASWFEKHLSHLARETERETGTSLADFKGYGPKRYLNFFKTALCDVSTLSFYQEVINAIVIRNALLHASGDLSLSKDAKQLRAIVKNKLYLDKDRRKIPPPMLDQQHLAEVGISENDFIYINYYYAQRAAKYFMEFLLNICDKRIST